MICLKRILVTLECCLREINKHTSNLNPKPTRSYKRYIIDILWCTRNH